MKNTVVILLLMSCGLLWSQEGETPEVPVSSQIKTALMPLPEGLRDGASVYGYTPDGTLKLLRKGTGIMICLADNPMKEGINVSCYPNSLETFMARGRQLSAAGKNFEERMKIRGEEIEAGKIVMPKDPSMLSICFGKDEDYNPGTGELKAAKYRYVIYTPFATSLSTGMPDTPQPGGKPWLMDAGTHRAHIMIGPFQ